MTLQSPEYENPWAWTAAAAWAPFAWFLGSNGWGWSLAWGLACGALLILGARRGPARLPRILAAAEWCFLALVLSWAAPYTARCWLTAERTAAFPLVLLVLGALGAGGAGRRAGAALFPIIALLALVLAAFAAPEVQPRWLSPGAGTPGAVIPFLLPGAALLLPGQKKSPLPWALGLAPAGAAVSALACGILSPAAAERTPGAFFHMARGISILGVAERFEAIVAAGLTLSWFCLLCLLLSAAGEMAESVHRGWKKPGTWLAAACAMIPIPINPWLMAGLAVGLWYVVPMGASAK